MVYTEYCRVGNERINVLENGEKGIRKVVGDTGKGHSHGQAGKRQGNEILA